MSPARLLKMSPEACRMVAGRMEGNLCSVEDPERKLDELRRQTLYDRASLQSLTREMERAQELGLPSVARDLQEHLNLVGGRLKDLETAVAELGRARGAGAAAGPPAGEGEGTVEAEFCGRTLVDVVLRVDAFMKATGLMLVERSLLGFVESRGESQECHRAVFRKGGDAARGGRERPGRLRAGRGERTVAEACAGLEGAARDVCIFIKARGGAWASEVAREFGLDAGEAAKILGDLEERDRIENVPPPEDP